MPSDEALPDRGEVYDRWAPRLQHGPLTAAMAGCSATMSGNPDYLTRRVLRDYLGAVNLDVLAADVAVRTGNLGVMGPQRIRATAEAIIEALTPDPYGTKREVPR